jgi:hypothetical protein
MNYYWLVLPVILTMYLLSTLHIRLKEINGQLMQAWYVQLPGWSESYYPEQKVDLSDWVGSSIKDLSVNVGGVKSPELEAAATLKAIGLYGNDYTEKQIDGHWILFRPEKTEKVFNMSANYRVSRYTPRK